MKKHIIEIRWGLIFVVSALAWMLFEKLMGWHGENIAQHATLTNLFALPAIAIYVFGLMDKRKHFYQGKMSWVQGFVAGLVITLVVFVFTPVSQYVTHYLITPDYFTNVIEYAVESGKMTRATAVEYFNFQSYLIQSLIGAVGMGVFTSALVALFVKKK